VLMTIRSSPVFETARMAASSVSVEQLMPSGYCWKWSH
jgi:hypothetical protein